MRLPRFRFRLRTVLAVTAFIAVGLGTFIYFRQVRLEQARRLADEGVGVLATSDAPAYLSASARSEVPFVRPAMAEIYVHLARDGAVFMDGQPVAKSEVESEIISKRDRVHTAGIKIVHLLFVAHECSVAELLNSVDGRENAMQLTTFAEKNEFASTGFLEESQIRMRKRNLDPQGVVYRK